ncbi:MAG TPA: hypothetical protein DCW31_00435 [Lactobacillus sp.]|nr:hypothetical protein [Lactobacillus sp.]
MLFTSLDTVLNQFIADKITTDDAHIRLFGTHQAHIRTRDSLWLVTVLPASHPLSAHHVHVLQVTHGDRTVLLTDIIYEQHGATFARLKRQAATELTARPLLIKHQSNDQLYAIKNANDLIAYYTICRDTNQLLDVYPTGGVAHTENDWGVHVMDLLTKPDDNETPWHNYHDITSYLCKRHGTVNIRG